MRTAAYDEVSKRENNTYIFLFGYAICPTLSLRRASDKFGVRRCLPSQRETPRQ